MNNCCKCKEPSEHAIQIRHGDLPDPYDPETKKKDKTGIRVYRFCKKHWREVQAVVPGL